MLEETDTSKRTRIRTTSAGMDLGRKKLSFTAGEMSTDSDILLDNVDIPQKNRN